ncbi:MAG: hypothetical protein GC162_00750 [Planctomycetes bacterium]|nr:hypothetical protein [Planctomycetota bacterium]
MKRLLSSFRLVLPPTNWIVLAAIIYILIPWGLRVFALIVQHAVDIPRPDTMDLDSLDAVRKAQICFLLACCAIYGLYRAVNPHPLFQSSYNAYLALTPWRFGAPLPSGPVTLAWPDTIFLAALTALVVMCHPELPPAWIMLVFTFPFLATMAISFFILGHKVWGYLVLASLTLYPLLWERSVMLLAAMALVHVGAWMGIRRTMWDYPWDLQELRELGRQFRKVTEISARRADYLGWPLQFLSLRDPSPVISYFDGVCISLLVGLWTYAAMTLVRNPTWFDPQPWLFCLFLSGVPPLIRIFGYCSRLRPPISLMGRLLTGRWLIPKYDIAVLVPMAIGGATLALATIASIRQWPVAWTLPLLVTFMLLLIINVGPTFARWQLTGAVRIVPKGLERSEFVEL